ncbi:hypothetical protein DU67_07470 [Methanosarcina mazei]|uniref:Uncharacterized protein n=2 Tax=Methanosarcina mazei TaxID=2209 RepID=A0A0F8GGT8_METMZ|nr:hypothetical protein DU30_00370 [Methanosarcina mazei]KKG64497.1 hypothetical protein DU67_07470 [Methanosarcina mazei]
MIQTLEERIADSPNDGDMTIIEISENIYGAVEEYGGYNLAIVKCKDNIYRLPDEQELIATIDEKKEVLKKLVNNGEVIMLFDSLRDCFRPVWLAEWAHSLRHVIRQK